MSSLPMVAESLFLMTKIANAADLQFSQHCSKQQPMIFLHRSPFFSTKSTMNWTDLSPLLNFRHPKLDSFVQVLSYEIRVASGAFLLKPVQGQEARRFSDVESMLFYLERVMRNEQRKEENNDPFVPVSHLSSGAPVGADFKRFCSC